MIKYVTPRKAAQCAREIIEWAIKNDMWSDCGIYVNGKLYCSYKADPGMNLIDERVNEFGEKVRVWEGNRDVSQYLEYFNKEHFISMFFEGPIYEALNLSGFYMDWCQRRENELTKIFEKFGYYYELGNSWNLSAYKK